MTNSLLGSGARRRVSLRQPALAAGLPHSEGIKVAAPDSRNASRSASCSEHRTGLDIKNAPVRREMDVVPAENAIRRDCL
jgi:hypothetical protein